MHSFWQRANALLTYAGTLLAILCIAVSITDYFHVADPVVSLDYLGVEGLVRERAHDRVFPVLNMTADLRSEFTWNTKQLFVYAAVEYQTEKNPTNSVVMWNTIIQQRENAYIYLANLRSVYPFAVTDQEAALRGKPFSVRLSWQVMPKVGALYSRSKTFTGFSFPEQYIERQSQGGRAAATA